MTHYDTMGLQPAASQDQIRDRYWELIPLVHPERGGDRYLLAALDEAYRTLGDPATRRRYDASLGLRPSTPPPRRRRRRPADWTQDRWETTVPGPEPDPGASLTAALSTVITAISLILLTAQAVVTGGGLALALLAVVVGVPMAAVILLVRSR